MSESVIGLSKLLQTPEKKICAVLEDITNKDQLGRIINHMIYVRLGGWRKDEEYYINEHNYRVPATRWNITEAGKLVVRESGKSPNYNLDKLYNLKRLLEDGRS